jgi:hypothetical protein
LTAAANGGSGVEISGGSLLNNGVISPGYGGTGYGIFLLGGVVSNRGTITGPYGESAIFQAAGTLQNYGVIENLSGFRYGIQIDSGTLINDGTIYSKDNGVFIEGGSVINNAVINGVSIDGGALINNGIIGSIESRYGGSFTNAGSVGNVRFGTGASRIIIDPGASFGGAVQATGSASHEVIELAAGTVSGSISGVGSEFTDFGVITFDPGAAWTVEGNASGLAAGQAISGFTAGDTIILDGFTEASFSYVSGAGLEIFDGTTTDTLDITGHSAPIRSVSRRLWKGPKYFSATCAARGS